MNQRLSLITLGVSNLEAMKRFYTEQFGWIPLQEVGDIVFFKLNGMILSLFPSAELAADAGVPAEGNGFKKFTLAVCLKSEAEVDQAFDELNRKGVMIIKPPQKVFWGGYSGYISDIENNLWEIAFNPFLEMDEEGNVVGQK